MNKQSHLLKILTAAGWAVFVFHLGLNPVTLSVSLLLAGLLFTDLKWKKNNSTLLLPLSSGLLCFLTRLFHWDATDMVLRCNILLITALLLSSALAIHDFKLVKRFLLYFNRLPLKKRLIYIFLFCQLMFMVSSYIIVKKGVVLGGDEPHYLTISHSIARDFDLNLFNQYAREGYRDFIDVRLHHHTTVGKGFKKWYSYGHLPGLSVTTAPFFLLNLPNPLLYFLVRSYLGLFGALLAVVIYLFCLKLWKHRNLAIFITAAFTLTVPNFFYSIHIFAELQVSLMILGALYLLLYADKKTNLTVGTAGFLLGATIFWGLKYNIFVYLFSAGFFVYFFFMKKQRGKAFLFILFPVLFQMLFFYYLYFAYGSFSLMTIYNGIMTEAQRKAYYAKVNAIPLGKRVETLLGIFFDQRDGLLLYSPLYFFFFPGLIIAFRKIKTYFPHLLIGSTAFGFILFQAFSTVRAGYCPQARYLTPAAWALMLFAVIYRNETKNRAMRRLFYFTPLYSAFVVVYQALNPFTLYQSATHINLNRPGLMFQQWSNLYVDLSSYLPSFVKVPGNFKYLPNVVFLLLFTALILLSLKKMKVVGIRGMAAAVLVFVFVLAVLLPAIPVHNPILLSKEGAIRCNIYGENPFPTRAKDWNFPLGGNGHDFTLSTLKQATYLVLEFENKGKENYT
ncbi:MAG: hypothetical protein GY765_08040, partial [bacterium]|nr:hypothetical protein [bacterium]